MTRPTAVLVFLCAALAFSAGAGAMTILPFSITKERSQVTETEKKAYDGLFVDRILVKKSERKLYLFKGDKTFRTYRISLGFQPAGHKQNQGDGRTPEGRYRLDWRNSGSKFRKSLHVSYPNVGDRLRARRKGFDPGGMIMIHGQPSRIHHSGLQQVASKEDWTQGCIAVSNLAIDEIWEYTRDGTSIEILP